MTSPEDANRVLANRDVHSELRFRAALTANGIYPTARLVESLLEAAALSKNAPDRPETSSAYLLGYEAGRTSAATPPPAEPAPAIDVERLAALLADPEHFGLLGDEGEPYEPEWWQEKADAIAREYSALAAPEPTPP